MTELNTMGDRILHLLRERGRTYRGKPYEQKELVAFLKGETKAPDGKYYNIDTSGTAISRLISGGLTRLDPDMLSAICDMFNTDLEWLVRGKVCGSEEDKKFFTEDANTVGELVDNMDKDMRNVVVNIVRQLYDFDLKAASKE